MTDKTRTPSASKAGAATSPQTTRSTGYVVAPDARVRIGGQIREAGYKVTADDLKTTRDPDGKASLQRLIDGGELVRGNAKADDRAGGGLITDGGATGAAPSGAQIAAADAGDEGSKKVVDAALTGSDADFTKAADPDGAGAKSE